METLSFWQFYLQALLRTFEFPDNLLGIIAIVFLLIKLIPPKWESFWRESKLNNIYQWAKKYSLHIFAVLILIAVVYAPYGIYKDRVKEINQMLEEHRPILTVEPVFDGNGIDYDEELRIAIFTMQEVITNVGDRPAYQTRCQIAMAPLDEPEKYSKLNEAYHANPIHSGINQIIVQSYQGSYSLRDDWGLIMAYVRIEYSNEPSGGTFYQDEYWIAVTIRFDLGESQFTWPKSEWIELHRPYIEELLQDD